LDDNNSTIFYLDDNNSTIFYLDDNNSTIFSNNDNKKNMIDFYVSNIHHLAKVLPVQLDLGITE
jgi:hypothetical protein